MICCLLFFFFQPTKNVETILSLRQCIKKGYGPCNARHLGWNLCTNSSLLPKSKEIKVPLTIYFIINEKTLAACAIEENLKWGPNNNEGIEEKYVIDRQIVHTQRRRQICMKNTLEDTSSHSSTRNTYCSTLTSM